MLFRAQSAPSASTQQALFTQALPRGICFYSLHPAAHTLSLLYSTLTQFCLHKPFEMNSYKFIELKTPCFQQLQKTRGGTPINQLVISDQASVVSFPHQTQVAIHASLATRKLSNFSTFQPLNFVSAMPYSTTALHARVAGGSE